MIVKCAFESCRINSVHCFNTGISAALCSADLVSAANVVFIILDIAKSEQGTSTEAAGAGEGRTEEEEG